MKQLSGTAIHIVFEVYEEEGHLNSLSKQRETKSRERRIAALSLQLPKISEWTDFLTNSKNKCRLMLLLADFYLTESKNMRNNVYVSKRNQCYQSTVKVPSNAVEVPDIRSNHREADPRIALHTVFASSTNESSAVCAVAEDTDVYILLLYMSQYCSEKVHFQQSTGSSNGGITYHDVKSLANHLGEAVCKIMPAFHALTGCDYTIPFLGRSKYSIFKNMQKDSNAERLLLSLNTERVEVPDVIDFIIHIAYNRQNLRKQLHKVGMPLLSRQAKRERSLTTLDEPRLGSQH